MATFYDRNTFFFCCVSCKDNKNIEEYAVNYCQQCQQCFCRRCCEQHDYLFSKHVMYDRLNMRNWPVSKELEAVLLMCEIHTHKHLDTFCKDHSQLCCSNCVSFSHRKCKKVTLNSAMKKAVDSQYADTQELFEKLLINMRKLKKLQRCCESEIQDLNSAYLGQEIMVQGMNYKIKSTLDILMRRTLQNTPIVEREKIEKFVHSTLFDIGKITRNETKRTLFSLQASLKTAVKTCSRRYHELRAGHEFLLYSSENKNRKLWFIAILKCTVKIQQVESYLEENSVKLECHLLNQTVQATEQYLSELSGLGRLVESMNANTDIKWYLFKLSVLVRVVSPVLGKYLHNVNISSDSFNCSITAICVLSEGQVLIADFNNNKVKLLNQQYHLVSHCGVNGYPNDICQITPNEVAVTLEDFSKPPEVQFITVTQSQLVLARKFQLQHKCICISHHQSDLYISSGTALYKYSMRGKLTNKVYENTSHEETVDRCAVSPGGDKLYITNPSQQRLLTLARNGTVLETFKDSKLHGPFSLHVTPAGHLLVCDFRSSTILQVDSEGRKKVATLATVRDGVWRPLSVCYSSTTSSIIVGRWWDNNILVFRVK